MTYAVTAAQLIDRNQYRAPSWLVSHVGDPSEDDDIVMINDLGFTVIDRDVRGWDYNTLIKVHGDGGPWYYLADIRNIDIPAIEDEEAE